MNKLLSFFCMICIIISLIMIQMINADIIINSEIPHADDNSIRVKFRGELNMLINRDDPNISQFISFTADETAPALKTVQLTLFTINAEQDGTNSVILTHEFNADEDVDVTELLKSSPYQYKTTETVYIIGNAWFDVPTDKIDRDNIVTYKANFLYKTSTDLSLTTTITQQSSTKGPAGAWIEPSLVEAKAVFYTYKNYPKRDFLSVWITNLPFSTKQATIYPTDHLTAVYDQTIECSINGADAELKIQNGKIVLDLEPENFEFVVLYHNTIHIICENLILTQHPNIGDGTNNIYIEMIDMLYDHPAGIEIPTKLQSLPTDFPFIDPDIITATLPTPSANNAIVCSYDIEFVDQTIAMDALNKNLVQMHLQGLDSTGVAPIHTYISLSASFTGSASTQARIPLFKAQIQPDSYATPNIFTTVLNLNRTNWSNTTITDQTAPLLLTYTFVLPKAPTPPPTHVLMPQCVLTYTDIAKQKSINQILMNVIGQPIATTGAHFNITNSNNKKHQHELSFELGPLNSGFNRLVVDLPQEDAHIWGSFECDLTQSVYPDGDSTKPANITTVKVTGLDRYGKPYHTIDTTDTTLFDNDNVNGDDDDKKYNDVMAIDVLWKFDSFVAGGNYTMKCPHTYITTLTNGHNNFFSEVSYPGETVVSVYAYIDDNDETFAPRYYLAGANLINLTTDGGDDGVNKKNLLIWGVIIGVLVLGVVLALLAIYSRAKKQNADGERFAFQTLEDEGVTN